MYTVSSKGKGFETQFEKHLADSKSSHCLYQLADFAFIEIRMCY